MNYKNNVRRASLVALGVMTALTAANAAVTLDAGFDTDGLAFVDFSTSTDCRPRRRHATRTARSCWPGSHGRAPWPRPTRCGWRRCA